MNFNPIGRVLLIKLSCNQP